MNIQIKNPIILLLILLFPFSNLAAEILYYDTDNVGSPVAMWDKNGNKVWEGEYYPFGEEFRVTDDQIKNKKRLIGKEKDNETGLTYFGARYMDETTGRFISPDPVRPVDAFTSKTNYTMLVNPQRLNRYAYGLNNPYRYVDPDGNWAEALLIEIPSIVVGGYSLVNNIKQGNVGSAFADAGGIFIDGAATLVPGVPGGVGLSLKVKRASKAAREAARKRTSEISQEIADGIVGELSKPGRSGGAIGAQLDSRVGAELRRRANKLPKSESTLKGELRKQGDRLIKRGKSGKHK